MATKRVAAKVGYTLGKWHQYTTYRCDFCPFDSTKLESIEEHLRTVHKYGRSTEEIAHSAGILLASKDGRVRSHDDKVAPVAKKSGKPVVVVEELNLELTEEQVAEAIKQGIIEEIDPPVSQ